MNVRRLAGEAGTVTDSYDYDAFGEIDAQPGSTMTIQYGGVAALGGLQTAEVYVSESIVAGVSGLVDLTVLLTDKTGSNKDKNKQNQDDEQGSPDSESKDYPHFTPKDLVGKSPQDLLDDGWLEFPHPSPNRRTFQSPRGDVVYYDAAQPGAKGWEGKNHFHVQNPHAVSERNPRLKQEKLYLDVNGKPVPEGSKPSHIPAAP